MTNNNTVLVIAVLIALALGFGGGYTVRGSQMPQGYHMMSGGIMMGDNTMGMGSAMSNMMTGLQGKTGDEFDKAFLSEMIMHHQGAVSMAEAAQTSAKHDEIKYMAENIISAQTSEIAQMKSWQKSWYNQ